MPLLQNNGYQTHVLPMAYLQLTKYRKFMKGNPKRVNHIPYLSLSWLKKIPKALTGKTALKVSPAIHTSRHQSYWLRQHGKNGYSL